MRLTALAHIVWLISRQTLTRYFVESLATIRGISKSFIYSVRIIKLSLTNRVDIEFLHALLPSFSVSKLISVWQEQLMTSLYVFIFYLHIYYSHYLQ